MSNVCFLSPPRVIYLTNLSRLVPEIVTFFKKACAKCKYHCIELGEMGFNLEFKRLRKDSSNS